MSEKDSLIPHEKILRMKNGSSVSRGLEHTKMLSCLIGKRQSINEHLIGRNALVLSAELNPTSDAPNIENKLRIHERKNKLVQERFIWYEHTDNVYVRYNIKAARQVFLTPLSAKTKALIGETFENLWFPSGDLLWWCPSTRIWGDRTIEKSCRPDYHRCEYEGWILGWNTLNMQYWLSQTTWSKWRQGNTVDFICPTTYIVVSTPRELFLKILESLCCYTI